MAANQRYRVPPQARRLDWHETLAGRFQTLKGVQSANLAVTAYSAGQAYLRLKRELPRFARPTAVVIVATDREQPPERWLRRGSFDGSGIPTLIVPIDQSWRLHPDFHPDARAHAAMARALLDAI